MVRLNRMPSLAIRWGAVLLLTACDAESEGSPGTFDPGTPSLTSEELSTTLGFRKQVTVGGIREHLAAFEGFAALNGGNRALGTAGYDASSGYVRQRLLAAGYNVSIQEFTFEFRGNVTPPILSRISPNPADLRLGLDFTTMTGTGSGDVTAAVYAVDLQQPAPAVSTSGCEASDFAGFPAGGIALLQRGTCAFRLKAVNAAQAGASAVIIANDITGAQLPGFGTLNLPQPVTIPVLQTTTAIGEALRQGVLNGPTQTTVRVFVNYVVENRTGANVIAETRTGDPTRVVVIGAGLESLDLTPGINFTTGAAAMLEVAEVMSQQGRTTTPRLRYIWFGGDRERRLGAEHYLEGLSSEERGQVKGMLEIRTIGSLNFGRFVYDGDLSTFPANTTPADGSDTIERLLTDYFTGVGLSQAPTSVSSVAADFAVFLEAGIPIGGLTSLGGGVKTSEQAILFGGTADALYDPCFGAPCDLLTNLSATALDQLSDAAAHAVLLLSKRNLAKNPL